MRKLSKNLILAAVALIPASAFAQYSTPVRDIDNGARAPYRAAYFCYQPSNSLQGSCQLLSPQVPTGYRFVVETVTGRLIQFLNYRPSLQIYDQGTLSAPTVQNLVAFVPTTALEPYISNGVATSNFAIWCTPVRFYLNSAPKYIYIVNSRTALSYDQFDPTALSSDSDDRMVTLSGYLVKINP